MSTPNDPSRSAGFGRPDRRTLGNFDPLESTIAAGPDSATKQDLNATDAGSTLADATFAGEFAETSDGRVLGAVGVAPRLIPEVAGYEILGEIGRGAMGVVYRAIRVGLNRECALKMILAGAHVDAIGALRFLAEAETVARLQHPNVVQIHHIGDSRGLPFFELEYVAGGSLDHLLEGNPWPARRAAELIHALAGGVAQAHGLNIIHRDLKPGNILVTLAGVPKITDFGLAKSIQLGDSGLTATESILGTPTYMSPEQAEGKNKEVGPAADIYSLGVILYELLTGRPPFRGASILETLALVKTAEAVAPSRLVPGIPRDLETIALVCLRKEPERRYASASTLSEDLRRFLAGETILARRSGAVRRAWRWCRRNPALAGSLAGLATALAVGFAGMALLWSRAELSAEDARRLAKVEFATRRESDRLYANLAVDKGIGLALGREVGPGLLWMAEAMGRAPEDAQGGKLRQVALANLSSWRGSMIRPESILHLPSPVLGMDVGPDGRVAATGSADGSLQFWDLTRSRPLGGPIRAHRVEPIPTRIDLLFRPDGKVLVSFGEDGTARLWDVASREPIGGPISHRTEGPDRKFWSSSPRDTVSAAAFSPDGKVLVTAGSDGLARFHDADTGRDLGRPIALASYCRSIAFNLEGSVVLTGGDSKTGQLWDARTGAPIGGEIAVANEVHGVAFSPDGKTFALGCYGKEGTGEPGGVKVYDSTTRRLLNSASIKRDSRVVLLRYRPDGRAALVATFAGDLHQFGTEDGRPIGATMHHDAVVVDASYGPDGRSILSGSEDGSARLWEAETGQLLGSPMEHGGSVRRVAYSPDGRRLLTASTDGTLRTWDASNVLAPGWSLPYVPSPPNPTAVFSPGGERLATASQDGTARIWDLATGMPVGPPLLHGGSKVRAVRFSPDGKILASGGDDRKIRLWDAATGRPVGTPMSMGHWVLSIQFSPEGSRLISGQVEGRARLFDPATSRQVGPWLDHPSPLPGHEIWVVGFSPDGRSAITGCSDGTLGVWDAATGTRRGEFARFPNGVRQILPLPGGRSTLILESEQVRVVDLESPSSTGRTFGRRVLFMALSPDGRSVLTGGRDRMARLWDVATGRPLGPQLEHSEAVASVSISPDGRTMATGTVAGLRFWDWATSKSLGAPLENFRLVDDLRTNDSRVPFSPDGRRIVGVGERIAIWPVPAPGDEPDHRLAATARLLAGMELDDQGGGRAIELSKWQAEKEELIGPGASGPAISDAEWHDRIAADCLARGPYRAGLWHLDRLIASRPGDWALFARRSTLQTRLGNLDAARADEARALALGPADRVGDWFRQQAGNPLEAARTAPAP